MGTSSRCLKSGEVIHALREYLFRHEGDQQYEHVPRACLSTEKESYPHILAGYVDNFL